MSQGEMQCILSPQAPHLSPATVARPPSSMALKGYGLTQGKRL